MEEKKTGMSTGRKILISMIVILFVLTAAAYGYGVYYFSGHFLPGSLVNGFNCSYMNQEEAEQLLEQKTAAYVLAIRTRGLPSFQLGQSGFSNMLNCSAN